MNNRTKRIAIVGFLLAVMAALLAHLFWQDQDEIGQKRGAFPEYLNAGAGKASPRGAVVASEAAPRAAVVSPDAVPPADAVEALLRTPIVFYGVVLDQNEKPIPSAMVEASVVDNSSRARPLPTTTTGPDGRFTLHAKGVSLHVAVSKEGHYLVSRGEDLSRSTQGFDYGADTGRGVHRPDPAEPVIFHLRKAGTPVVLEALNGQTKVPRDGSAVTLNLNTARSSRLTVRCATHEDESNPAAPFDWRCEIETQGGGIQEAKDGHSFVAPAEGFMPMVVIDMPKTLPLQEWSKSVSRRYWLRFADGTFGKIEFRMVARGDHFAVANGWRNPALHDRNLEPKGGSR